MRGIARSLKRKGSAVDSGAGASAAGFTVIEILMALAIMSIAFGTIYNSFAHFNRSCTTENVTAGIQQSARVAVEFMVQDIRLAGLDPLGSGLAGITPGSPPNTNLQFTADLNFDGDVDDPFENVTYFLDNGKLKQTNHLGTEILLDDVTGLNFTYLDTNDQTTSTASEIRSVIISLTMRRPAGREEPVTRTYTTQVRCRNL